jgi:hypothetical protein
MTSMLRHPTGCGRRPFHDTIAFGNDTILDLVRGLGVGSAAKIDDPRDINKKQRKNLFLQVGKSNGDGRDIGLLALHRSVAALAALHPFDGLDLVFLVRSRIGLVGGLLHHFVNVKPSAQVSARGHACHYCTSQNRLSKFPFHCAPAAKAVSFTLYRTIRPKKRRQRHHPTRLPLTTHNTQKPSNLLSHVRFCFLCCLLPKPGRCCAPPQHHLLP